MSFSIILASSIALVLLAIVFVLDLVSNWKVFVKMGEPGWKCIIPFYSLYVECKHVWSIAGFWLVLLVSIAYGITGASSSTSTAIIVLSIIFGLAGFVCRIIFYHFKSRAFGKGVGFTILWLLFPFITNLIIGFGASQYEGNKALK